MVAGSLFAAALGAVACGRPALEDRVATYREAVEETVGIKLGPQTVPLRSRPALPERRARRVTVEEQRIGPFDFLAIVGCPLSEVVAARNAPLGRVLEPTRRLAHELRVIDAVEDCLPKLGPERQARLRAQLVAKRADLGAHVWNAVWLDEDLERFLQAGPRTLIGGEDPADGSRQLRRAANALEERDVEALEQAFAQLRDDPAVGPLLGSAVSLADELERVASAIAPIAVMQCGQLERKLSRVFVDRFVPLQGEIGRRDGDSRELLDELGRLFNASAEAVVVPAAMRAFGRDVIGNGSTTGLWSRQRRAIIAHAKAWGPILTTCRVIPAVEA